MTTIRHMKELHKFNAPDDRLRQPYCPKASVFRLTLILLLILLSAYAAPDFIAWARGDAPVVMGRMK